PRLHVERDGLLAAAVRALQVAELHELVPAETWMAVGDDEVSLARRDRQARREERGLGARGVHDGAGVEAAVRRLDGARAERAHRAPLAPHGAQPSALL